VRLHTFFLCLRCVRDKSCSHCRHAIEASLIVALSFHYSAGTETIYDSGQDIKGAKVTEHSLEEGEHLVSLVTCHFSLPRMLQSIILHTNKGRPLDDIRLAQPRRDESSSLVYLAHQREYKRLHDNARDVKTRTMTDVNMNWLLVRSQVQGVGEKCYGLLLETDEAKALNEIRILQALLHKRFDNVAKVHKIKATKEMNAALKQGREKEQEIMDKFISEGSECLKEHQSVVNHLSIKSVLSVSRP
jgi:hypothetical protein